MTKQDNSKPQPSAAPSGPTAPSTALGPAPTSGPAAPTAAAQNPEPPREPRSRDGLVVTSIVIVAAAVAVMCRSQLGLSLPISAAAGIVTLALLMLIHKQMQKSAQIAQLKAEIAQSRQAAARPRALSRAPQAASPAPSLQASTAEARIRELSRDIGNLVPRSESGPLPASPSELSLAGPSALERATRTPRAPQPIAEADAQSAMEANAAPQAVAPAPRTKADAPAATSGASHGEPAREQWSFRPRNDAQASVQDASAVTNTMNGGAQGQKTPVATTIEGDLELVQRKIKELADEVNAAEALRPKPQLVAQRQTGPSNALEDSIGALRAAAKTMRGRPSLGDFVPKLETQGPNPQPVPKAASKPEPRKSAPSGFGDLVIPATAERIAGSDPAQAFPKRGERDVAAPNLELPLPDFAAEPPSPALPPRAAAIARAVEDDAIDVLLGPIVTLAEHSVSHYEMGANLRSPTGEPLDFNEDDFALIGGEFDSRFDIARLNRAAALAARMDEREREGSLLVDVLGSSMTSRAFLEAFANAYESRQRISAQLVLTFSQQAVDTFSPSTWQAVRDMHAFGFRLALDKVRHMGTDFAALQRSGFRFVRLDAEVLLDGMATPERFVPAEEILQRATLAGLSIIAGGIQDAAMQKRLLDSGVTLGQGPLFGAPRPVNVDSGSGPADQSAAA